MKKMKFSDRARDICRKSDSFLPWDWLLFAALTGFCFLSYMHGDILVTGNRSWILYDGIAGFYDNVAEWTQSSGANYMPSTFWLFALWNLPLKIAGVAAPESVSDSRLLLCFWYKLLPLLAFAAASYLLFRVAEEIGMGRTKARAAMFAFMTSPVCIFSQFIFAQCDIFTLLFLLWGMYYFYHGQKGDMRRFAFLLGVSVTFKYFAAVIFFVFLLVREKKVRNILGYSLLFLLPFACEFLIYAGSAGFQAGVLGFNVLSYVSSSDISGTVGTVSYMKFGCIFMVLWAYFVHAKDKKEETAWTLYLSCGVCFALFGFCVWHPQWLMFMAPFLVLSAFISRHLEKFLWLDVGMLVILHFLCSQAYKGNIDANLLQYLIWRNTFQTEQLQYYIADVLPAIGVNTTYSAFLAVLLSLFVFKHPNYALQDYSGGDGTDHMNLIRLRLVLTVGLFSVTAFAAAWVNTALTVRQAVP